MSKPLLRTINPTNAPGFKPALWEQKIFGQRAAPFGQAGSMMGLFHKILAHGVENVQQDAILHAGAAMRYFVGFQKRIALADDPGLIADGELKRALGHIGNLGMRMVMQRADGAFFEMQLTDHQIVAVSQHFADHAAAQVGKFDFLAKNEGLIFVIVHNGLQKID